MEPNEQQKIVSQDIEPEAKKAAAQTDGVEKEASPGGSVGPQDRPQDGTPGGEPPKAARAKRQKPRRKDRVGRYFYGKPEDASKRRRARGSVIAAFIACSLVSMLIGVLAVYYIIIPLQMRAYASATAEAQPSASSEPVVEAPRKTAGSYPEQLPDIGGQLPVIRDSANPVPDIVEQLDSAVVSIVTQSVVLNDDKQPVVKDVNGGTGFFISKSGYVVTNNHVVEKGSQFIVRDTSGKEYSAEYVGNNSEIDIAVLKVESSEDFNCVPIGSSSMVRIGELAVAIGNPQSDGSELFNTVTVGYVSAVKRQMQFNGSAQEFIQTDAALNPGSSGGPLFNSKGQVIGVNTLKSVAQSKYEDGTTITNEGIGFAIPIDTVMDNVYKIILTGSIKKPGVGMYFYELGKDELAEYGLAYGAYVVGFMTDSPAESAGMKVEDIIVECDGTPLDKQGVLAEIIQRKNIGDKISFKVYRDKEYVDINAEVVDVNALR